MTTGNRKYKCILLIALFLMLAAGNGFSQRSLLDKRVKIKSTSGTIEKILDEISTSGGFTFTYSSVIPLNKIIELGNNKQTVQAFLNEIFKDDLIRFYPKKDKILLVPYLKSDVNKLQKITGQVLEKGTNEPLEFANIFMLNRNMGTISNNNGKFMLNFKTCRETDTLCISSLGYKPVKIPMNSIDSTFITIKLIPEILSIKEVRISPIEPLDLIRKALDNIKTNYDEKPCLLTAFFRESTKKDNIYISLSEALLKIYKEPYLSFRNDQIKIEKGRKGSNIASQEYINYIVQGGLYNNFRLDLVKYGINFLDKDYFDYYSYKLDKISRYRGLPVYIIRFDQKDIFDYPCYTGKIYIDKESLAIVNVEFELSPKSLDFARDLYIIRTPHSVKVKPLSAEYKVNYRKTGDRWNLDYVMSEVRIYVKSDYKRKRRNKMSSIFTSKSEYVITDKDTANVNERFKFKEVSKPDDILVKQIVETDEDFWGEDNIILPEEPLVETINKINKKNLLPEPEIPVATSEEPRLP